MDILLAVAVFLVTSATAYLGVHVTLHPAQTDEAKRGYKIAFGALTCVAAGLVIWQSLLNQKEQGKLHAQLNQIQKNTEQSSPRAIIETVPVTKPFLRKDGHVQVNSLVRNTGTLNADISWSSNLWIFWDSEVPKEHAPQAKFEDNLWQTLEAKSKTGPISGSIGLRDPQIRSTVGDETLSEDDIRAIEQGQKLVYVLAIIRYPDNHETDFCGFYWSENKGNYQACREHNPSH